MQPATRLHPLPRTTNGTNWIRKAAQHLTQWRQDRQMRRDFARIAQTAPHLLADAGFAPEGAANIWHRDGLRVTIRQAPDQPPQVIITYTPSR